MSPFPSRCPTSPAWPFCWSTSRRSMTRAMCVESATRWPEILLLVVCGTIADCDDYEHIAAWGEAHLDFLCRHLPYENGVPGGRWLDHPHEPDQSGLVLRCLHGLGARHLARPSRPRGHRRQDVAPQPRPRRGQSRRSIWSPPSPPLRRLVLGQEAVPDKANEIAAIPVLLARLAEQDGLRGALVSIDAIATNADDRPSYPRRRRRLSARGQGQPARACALRSRPASPPSPPARCRPHTTTMTRVTAVSRQRTVSVMREVDWLSGDRRFPGELRLPDVACHRPGPRLHRTRRKNAYETRYYISSAILDRRASRQSDPRSLGDREPPALGARRRRSAMTSPVCARATAQGTWPSSATSL